MCQIGGRWQNFVLFSRKVLDKLAFSEKKNWPDSRWDILRCEKKKLVSREAQTIEWLRKKYKEWWGTKVDVCGWGGYKVCVPTQHVGRPPKNLVWPVDNNA